MSTFLRELSNDNQFVKDLSMETFSPIVESADVLAITPDNVDFYWNLLEFHFNVITEKEGSIGVFARLNFYLSKVSTLLG